MKKELLLSIFLLPIFVFIANSQQTIKISDSILISTSKTGKYIIKKDGVYFEKFQPSWSSLIGRPEKFECDIASFEILNNGYAKDRYNFYYNGIKINDVDYDSFSIIEIDYSPSKFPWGGFGIIYEYYAKDKYQVYCGEKIIKNADPNTFEFFSILYAKDSNYVFYRGDPIESADANSFQFIKDRFAKDKNHVYHLGKIISDNPASFQILDYESRYAKDKDYTFYWWGNGPIHIDTLKDANVDSVKVISKFYATDAEKVFWCAKIIPDAELNTFKIINRGYSCDKKHVYWRNKMIAGANPESFELLGNYLYFSKDDKYVYYMESLIEGADYKSFTPLSYQWGKDKNFIYFENTKREDIDYKSFEIIAPLAKDKYFIYDNLGRIIKKNIQD